MELSVDGKRAYAYTGGKPFDASLPALVFIHGAGQDHGCWALQSRYFAHHGYAVLAVDLPGHGRSEGPTLTTVSAMAAWTAALMASTKIDQAAIIGHSMGSLVAIEAAARYPEHVRFIALLGSVVPMPVADKLLSAAGERPHDALAMINVWSHSTRAQIGGNAVPGLWMLGINRRLMERIGAGVLRDGLAACNAYVEGMASAARVACPALILCGSRDQMTPPRGAKRLADALDDATLVTLDGAGHALMAEQPDKVLDILREFLIRY